ncbi:MAG: hypothetical protein LBG95_04500 [Treponema sp.]|jgi:hypothetical protein|nr:hypothetical protein [Treponema sp.]
MKKLIVFLAVFALLAGVAFAQDISIGLGGWGRGTFSPLVNVGAPKAYGEEIKEGEPDYAESENYAGTGVDWGGPEIETEFTVWGRSDLMGFHVCVAGQYMNTLNYSIWAKPFDNELLKLTVGKFEDLTLRGSVATASGFEDFVVGGLGEDAVFSRFDTGGTNGSAPNGFLLSSAPVEGLFIGLMLNGALWNWGGPDSGTPLAQTYRYMQLGFGYKIPDIGHIRAQYFGGWAGTVDMTDKNTAKYYEEKKDNSGNFAGYKLSRIEAAFALTAIENVFIDLGAKIWLPLELKNTKKINNGIDVGLGFNIRPPVVDNKIGLVGNLNVTGLGASERAVLGTDDSTKGINIAFNFVPDFNLGFASIGLSFGLRMNNMGKKLGNGDPDDFAATSQIGFGAFIQKPMNGWATGYVKAGLAYQMAPTEINPADKNKKGANGSSVFSIPILIEYWF